MVSYLDGDSLGRHLNDLFLELDVDRNFLVAFTRQANSEKTSP